MTEKIEKLLEEKFQEEGFEDCFLVDLKLHTTSKLEVFIDADKGIDFDRCRLISRFLEKHIEENKWFGEKYTLDVSSPGLDKPLKLHRQYKKNIGRKLDISMHEGKAQEGILKEVHDDFLILEQKVKSNEKGRKKKELVYTEIPFSNIKKTKVKIMW